MSARPHTLHPSGVRNYMPPTIEAIAEKCEVFEPSTSEQMGKQSKPASQMYDTLTEPFSIPVPDLEQLDAMPGDEAPKARALRRSSKFVPHRQISRFQTVNANGDSATDRSSPSITPSNVGKRYYSYALSETDRLSLGDYQDRRIWTLKDVVVHHQSRTELIPLDPERDKRMEAVLEAWGLAEERLRQSESDSRFQFIGLSPVDNSPERPVCVPLSRQVTHNRTQIRQLQNHMASRSMNDLRSITAPTFTVTPPSIKGDVEYFSRPRPRPHFVQTQNDASSSYSPSTTRLNSPFIHKVKPEVTFDAILAEHSKDALAARQAPRSRISKEPSYDMILNQMRKRKSTGNILGRETSCDASNTSRDGEKASRLLTKIPSMDMLTNILRKQKLTDHIELLEE